MVNIKEVKEKLRSVSFSINMFFGSMKKDLLDMMYSNPKKFKEEQALEESFAIVDEVVSSISKESFEKMSFDERVSYVKSIVDKQKDVKHGMKMK